MKKISVLILSNVFFLLSCEFLDKKLKIVNKTSKNIIAETSQHQIFYTENLLEFYVRGFDRDHIIGYNEIDTLSTFNRYWEDEIALSYNKKLNLYVFELDSALKYKGLNEAYQHGAYLKKMELSKEELEARDWVVEIK